MDYHRQLWPDSSSLILNVRQSARWADLPLPPKSAQSKNRKTTKSRTVQNTSKDTGIAVKTHGTNWLVGPSWGGVEYMAPVGIPAGPSMVTELRNLHRGLRQTWPSIGRTFFPGDGRQWDLIEFLQVMAGREDAWRIVEKMKWGMRVAGFNMRDRFHLQLM